MTLSLAELQALCDAATPGPWTCTWAYEDDHDRGVDFIVGPEYPSSWDPNEMARDEVVVGDSGVYPPKGPDARFIAAARTAVPELLARVRQLEAALKAVLLESEYDDPDFSVFHDARKLLP